MPNNNHSSTSTRYFHKWTSWLCCKKGHLRSDGNKSQNKYKTTTWYQTTLMSKHSGHSHINVRHLKLFISMFAYFSYRHNQSYLRGSPSSRYGSYPIIYDITIGDGSCRPACKRFMSERKLNHELCLIFCLGTLCHILRIQ